MLVRTNRDTGEPFLGCSRFPRCRGTREVNAIAPAPNARKARPGAYKLSAGGRPRGVGDYTELLVARALGRNLTPLQGCVVQLLAIIVFAAAVYALFASGLFLRIIEPFVQWYAEQALPRPSQSP